MSIPPIYHVDGNIHITSHSLTPRQIVSRDEQHTNGYHRAQSHANYSARDVGLISSTTSGIGPVAAVRRLTPNQISLLTKVCEITGISAEDSLRLLSAFLWDADSAIEAYYRRLDKVLPGHDQASMQLGILRVTCIRATNLRHRGLHAVEITCDRRRYRSAWCESEQSVTFRSAADFRHYRRFGDIRFTIWRRRTIRDPKRVAEGKLNTIKLSVASKRFYGWVPLELNNRLAGQILVDVRIIPQEETIQKTRESPQLARPQPHQQQQVKADCKTAAAVQTPSKKVSFDDVAVTGPARDEQRLSSGETIYGESMSKVESKYNPNVYTPTRQQEVPIHPSRPSEELLWPAGDRSDARPLIALNGEECVDSSDEDEQPSDRPLSAFTQYDLQQHNIDRGIQKKESDKKSSETLQDIDNSGDVVDHSSDALAVRLGRTPAASDSNTHPTVLHRTSAVTLTAGGIASPMKGSTGWDQDDNVTSAYSSVVASESNKPTVVTASSTAGLIGGPSMTPRPRRRREPKKAPPDNGGRSQPATEQLSLSTIGFYKNIPADLDFTNIVPMEETFPTASFSADPRIPPVQTAATTTSGVTNTAVRLDRADGVSLTARSTRTVDNPQMLAPVAAASEVPPMTLGEDVEWDSVAIVDDGVMMQHRDANSRSGKSKKSPSYVDGDHSHKTISTTPVHLQPTGSSDCTAPYAVQPIGSTPFGQAPAESAAQLSVLSDLKFPEHNTSGEWSSPLPSTTAAATNAAAKTTGLRTATSCQHDRTLLRDSPIKQPVISINTTLGSSIASRNSSSEEEDASSSQGSGFASRQSPAFAQLDNYNGDNSTAQAAACTGSGNPRRSLPPYGWMTAAAGVQQVVDQPWNLADVTSGLSVGGTAAVMDNIKSSSSKVMHCDSVFPEHDCAVHMAGAPSIGDFDNNTVFSETDNVLGGTATMHLPNWSANLRPDLGNDLTDSSTTDKKTSLSGFSDLEIKGGYFWKTEPTVDPHAPTKVMPIPADHSQANWHKKIATEMSSTADGRKTAGAAVELEATARQLLGGETSKLPFWNQPTDEAQKLSGEPKFPEPEQTGIPDQHSKFNDEQPNGEKSICNPPLAFQEQKQASEVGSTLPPTKTMMERYLTDNVLEFSLW